MGMTTEPTSQSWWKKETARDTENARKALWHTRDAQGSAVAAAKCSDHTPWQSRRRKHAWFFLLDSDREHVALLLKYNFSF